MNAPSASPGGNPSGPQWRSFARNVALIAVLLGMLWLAFNVRLPSVDELQARIAELGWIGWLAFIALYAVVAMTPIPVTVMAITGGVVFGVIEGSVLSVVGVLIGCWLAYWLARGLGKDAVLTLLGRHARTVERSLDGSGAEAVFMLRLMPGIPYWPVNYGAGVFGVSQRDFVIASAGASVPGQVSLVAIGAFTTDPTFAHGAIVVIAWIVVIVMTLLAYRKWRSLSRHDAPGEDAPEEPE